MAGPDRAQTCDWAKSTDIYNTLSKLCKWDVIAGLTVLKQPISQLSASLSAQLFYITELCSNKACAASSLLLYLH